jgi:hypothetical protein
MFQPVPLAAVHLHEDTHQHTPNGKQDDGRQVENNQEGGQHITYIQEDKAGGKQKYKKGNQQDRPLHNLVDKDHGGMYAQGNKIKRKEIAEIQQQLYFLQIV